jgi:hypothetical protein
MSDRTASQPDGPYLCECKQDLTAEVIAEREQEMLLMRLRRGEGQRTWSVWVKCACGKDLVFSGTWQTN